MIGAFQHGPFQPLPAYQQVEPEEGIGLAAVARPIDIVIQSPLWRQRFVRPAPVQRMLARREESDLQEMMQLYRLWKRGH